jgi:hypothetical protein
MEQDTDVIDVEPQLIQVVQSSERLRPFNPELSPRERWVYNIPDDPSYYQKWIQIASGWLGGAKHNKNASNWYGKLREQLGEIASWYLIDPETGLFRPTLLYELIKIQDFTQEQTVVRSQRPVPEEMRSHFQGELTAVRIINEFDSEAGVFISQSAPNPSKPRDWSAWKIVQQTRVTEWSSSQTSTLVLRQPTTSVPEVQDLSGSEVGRINKVQGWRSRFETKATKREKAYLQQMYERGKTLRLAGEESLAEGFNQMDEILDEESPEIED